MLIRPATSADAEEIWQIFHAVVAGGDVYPFDPEISRTDALAYWFQTGAHGFVSEIEGEICGSYIVKPNQPGLGAHIANAAFMVAPSARGRGVGRALGEHCLAAAKRLGFRAMQFNFVVATNKPAVVLWQNLGFEIIATVPQAFRHRALGYVDAHVMFRTL
ncbi:MAG: GNAT family N-acetyltransferase [Chthoniobacterales bacterium]